MQQTAMCISTLWNKNQLLTSLPQTCKYHSENGPAGTLKMQISAKPLELRGLVFCLVGLAFFFYFRASLYSSHCWTLLANTFSHKWYRKGKNNFYPSKSNNSALIINIIPHQHTFIPIFSWYLNKAQLVWGYTLKAKKAVGCLHFLKSYLLCKKETINQTGERFYSNLLTELTA